jgi:hypothetical protein
MARERGLGKEQFWRQALARWQRSGLSVSEFCAGEELTTWCFYWWRRKLARRDQHPDSFLPVEVAGSSLSLAVRAGIEIVLADSRRLLVQPGFDPQTLRQVLDVLEEPAC